MLVVGPILLELCHLITLLPDLLKKVSLTQAFPGDISLRLQQGINVDGHSSLQHSLFS